MHGSGSQSHGRAAVHILDETRHADEDLSARVVGVAGFRVQDSGFRVQGSRSRVQGSGFRV